MPVLEMLEWEVTVDDRWICPTCVRQIALEHDAREAVGLAGQVPAIDG